MSWNDAVAFCEWLSRKEGRTYRLPTEAEWEYACRAGTTTAYQHGDDPEDLVLVGNVADGTFKAFKAKFPQRTTINARDDYIFTAPVGKFRPNDFGLHDMHGNVGEWCADWYDAKYYANSPSADPAGPSSGAFRVCRGGSWNIAAGGCRSACRSRNVPSHRVSNLGFRLALSPFNE